jgi:glycosyltransferase involved in cell wall biosynthesis
MRIIAFSINPLFPDRVTGGASKHLQNIAVHLGALGHEVIVLCTSAPQSDSLAFKWHPNVEVRPILPFHMPFPQPYAISAHEMALILQDMGDALATADRFYMHDGEFLFPFTYSHIPTVISLRDNVYPETLLGGYLFSAHKMILISDYSRRFVEATMGRFFSGLSERIQVIPNGLDWSRFKPTPVGEILKYIPFDLSAHLVVVHPHRPEESKGILQTIAVTDLLVNQYGHTTLRVLIPRWMETQNTPELLDFYHRMQNAITSRGLTEHIIFHEWIPQPLMPEYYSLGAVTLALGHFAESFGNAVYESLGCGTPTIAARITTHRELLPDDLLDKVDFDDASEAARRADIIIRDKRRTSPETLAYLNEYYGIERQLNAYAQAILSAQVAPPITYRHPIRDTDTPHSLAPWCYLTQRGVYHDFRADYTELGTLIDLLREYPTGVTRSQAENAGISPDDFERRYREGFIVPV